MATAAHSAAQRAQGVFRSPTGACPCPVSAPQRASSDGVLRYVHVEVRGSNRCRFAYGSTRNVRNDLFCWVNDQTKPLRAKRSGSVVWDGGLGRGRAGGGR